jgi:O-antigen/teichoic acid export membrane protein
MLARLSRPLAQVLGELVALRRGGYLSMHTNSLMLMGGVTATAAFGQLAWLVAARRASPSEVGLASAVIAAMALCAQVALGGLGAAAILELPRAGGQASRYLRVVLTAAGAGGLMLGAGTLAIASRAGWELGVVASSPWFALCFLAATSGFTVWLLLDWVASGVRRGDQALVRSLGAGLVRCGLIGVLAVGGALGTAAIFGSWVAGCLVACGLGAWQLSRVLPGFRMVPLVDRPVLGAALRQGLPHHALTLSLLAPGLILQIVVTERISPEANAYWYMAWMLAGLTLVIPTSFGSALFAEVAHEAQQAGPRARQAIRSSLVLGVPVALVVTVGGEWLLALLGERYRTGAVWPLRVLVWGVVPAAFMETYVAVSRARRQVREPVVVQIALAAVAVGGALVWAPDLGLVGLSVAWLGLMLVGGAFASWRLVSLTRAAADRAQPVRRPLEVPST